MLLRMIFMLGSRSHSVAALQAMLEVGMSVQMPVLMTWARLLSGMLALSWARTQLVSVVVQSGGGPV